MTILYFTATGNGLYLAKKIGGKLISIPKTIKEGNFSFNDDKIGLIFPIYGLSVPAYIQEFLCKVKLNSSYIFAVMSYGMYDGAAVNHLLEIAERCGINFSYISTIKMVDNYLPTYYIENQIKNEPKKHIERQLNTIISDINNLEQAIAKTSVIDRFMTNRFIKAQTHRGEGIAKNFLIEETCTKCGICAKVCPVDNIKVESPKPVFAKGCISCLSCTQNCPQNAIRLKGEKSRERFRNQHISLKEIIESNS